MSRRKTILLVVTCLCVIAGSYLVAGRAPAAQSPDDLSVALEDGGAGYGMKSTDELIVFWGDRFTQNPSDYISAAFLGEAFLRKGRETGDVADYQRAEAALEQALALAPDYDVAQAYMGAALFVQHDFTGALDLAGRIYAANPRAAQALATIGDAQLELGDYAAAGASYRALAALAPGPAVASRLSRLAWLQGHPDQALALMQQAADQATALGLTGEGAAWYQFQLGELSFNTGQYDAAARHYATAEALFPNYYLALAGLGKARAAQRRYPEAIALYERAVAIVPQPDFLAALGDLDALTGRPDDARQQYETVEFIGNLAALNKVVYNRQLALFAANHDRRVDVALDLASKEYAARKDVYGADALAWALYKNGRYQDAAAASDAALALGTRDALLDYHAGMIAAALGDRQRARTLLAAALALNPQFDLLQAPVARATLARLEGP